jgi:putative PIN family toxin of toxin-antitoxin system
MRVIFDANVLLSFLLASDPNQTVAWVVRTCFFTPGIAVLAPQELIEETTQRALTKPYFQNKISPNRIQGLLSMLTTHSETPPAWRGEMPHFGTDRKDDYLVAYGLLLNADYLVTGDRHLLTLGQIDQLRILAPATMVHVLEQFIENDS